MVVVPYICPTPRRQDIDRAKGLAIVLVVFGHLVARADPLGVIWYEPLRRAVYAFHMPFFLYLSGVVAVFSGALYTRPENWTALLCAKARRLLIPFFAIGLLIVFGKLLAQHFLYVDNHTPSLGAGLANLVWHTVDSPAGCIWYLFVLFLLSVLAPVLVWANFGELYYLLIAAFILYCAKLPPYLYLDQFGKYAIFFCIGVFAASRDERWTEFVNRRWRPLFLLFLLILALIAGFGKYWPVKPELFLVGILSLPALHGLVRHSPIRSAPMLLWLGENCFVIYLFNTIFIGIAKALLLRMTDWNGSHFLFFAPVMMLSGIFGPVLLRQVLFKQVGILDRYTK